MTEDDLIFGARSGIQKAIRRGDLDLGKTSFDLLWASKPQQQWLKWRIPVLVAEEAWFFAGELAEFLQGKSQLEADWRKFLYRLILVPKSKDAGGLSGLSGDPPSSYETDGLLSRQLIWEMQQMRGLRETADDNDPTSISKKSLEDMISGNGELSDYERAGMRALLGRVYAGGMVGDKWMLLGAVILFASRQVLKVRVRDLEKIGIKRWTQMAGKRKPRTVEMPWYAFDMHTAAGGFAANVFMKRKASDFGFKEKKDFLFTWFMLESGVVPDDFMYPVPPDTEEVKAQDTAWWTIEKEFRLRVAIQSYTVDEFIEKQWPVMREELEGIVQWCLRKREEK